MFLLDDHEVVRRGVRELLEGADDLEVVGEAGTAAEALQRVPATAPMSPSSTSGSPTAPAIEVCRELRSQMPDLKCLMLTSFNDDEALFDAIMAGAVGIRAEGGPRIRPHRQRPPRRRRAVAARPGRDGARARTAAQPADGRRADRLADTAGARILDLLADGQTNRQIAEQMFLAEKTVKNYVSNLLAKLGMSHRTQAAVYAARLAERRAHRPTD